MNHLFERKIQKSAFFMAIASKTFITSPDEYRHTYTFLSGNNRAKTNTFSQEEEENDVSLHLFKPEKAMIKQKIIKNMNSLQLIAIGLLIILRICHPVCWMTHTLTDR